MKDYINLPYSKLMQDKIIFKRLSKHDSEQKTRILEVVNRLEALLAEIDCNPKFALVQSKIELYQGIKVGFDTIVRVL